MTGLQDDLYARVPVTARPPTGGTALLPRPLACGIKELGLGVVNPRTEAIASLTDIRSVIEPALDLYPREHMFLNPDCGFGTFSNRPVHSAEIAFRKLKAIVAAARSL
jgi:5-methyltetrahydropteroyltriglutamate--homocysteine methyltransferase